MTKGTGTKAKRPENKDKSLEFLHEIIDSVEGYLKIQRMDPIEQDMPVEYHLNAVQDYYNGVVKAVENDRPIVWHAFAFIPELLLAYDKNFLPYMGELSAAMFAMFDWDKFLKYMAAGEGQGLAKELCTVNRCLVGPMVANASPAPTAFITLSAPCDSSGGMYQYAGKYLKDVPMFTVDMPSARDERAVGYLAAQLFDLIKWFEERFGWKLDFDRLREVVKVSNETSELLVEINDIRKSVPCPVSGKQLGIRTFTLTANYGHPSALECLRKCRDHARKMLREGKSAATNERIRALWWGVALYYDLPLNDWMQEKYGAVIPMDMLSIWAPHFIDPATPETMLRGIARKMMNYLMTRQLRGPMDYMTEDLWDTYYKYSCNCVIGAGHIGCQHASGAEGAVREMLREKGIPTLMFRYDCLDARLTEAYYIRDMLEQFFEVQVIPALDKK